MNLYPVSVSVSDNAAAAAASAASDFNWYCTSCKTVSSDIIRTTKAI